MTRSLLLTALVIGLTGCAPPKTIIQTQIVKEYVPQIVTVPVELTADCQPAPLTDDTLRSIIEGRLGSVEAALAACRDRMNRIRALPSTP